MPLQPSPFSGPRVSHCNDDLHDNGPHRSVTDFMPMDALLKRTQTSGARSALSLNSQSFEARVLPSSSFFGQALTFIRDTVQKMLNSKELAKVLNANVHSKVFNSWLVMSPNATLLAYSGIPNIKQLRDQATLLSQIWKEESDKLRELNPPDPNHSRFLSSSASTVSTIPEGALETVTIESMRCNIIIRAVQPRMLLVLIGGTPPDRRAYYLNVTPEVRGGQRYPPRSVEGTSTAAKADSPQAGGSDMARDESPPPELLTQSHDEPIIDGTKLSPPHQTREQMMMAILNLQRQKMDAATEYLRKDFAARYFVMPDESNIP